MLFALAACAASPIKHVEGQTVYTQLNLWVDSDKHLTTNYEVGWRLPVNSRVRIGETSGDTIEVQVVDSGREFAVVNVEGYSGQDIAGIYDRYFAESPRDLDELAATEVSLIRDGEIEAGMSKTAVLIARGYPPAHETASIEDDEWKYWINRFNTELVSFENGRVVDITD